jgi:hypothetical protein
LTAITGTTVTAAETDATGKAVFDAVEVALMVTVPAGAVMGDVNVVAVPLAVWAGLKAPHGVLVQVTVQSTPAPATSLVTIAVYAVPVPAVTDVAAAGEKTIEIAGTMVIVAEALFVLSVVEVAVAVAVPPVGTVDGAV